MEEAYRARIQILENYLDTAKKEALIVLCKSEGDGVTVEEVITVKSKLKQILERFSTSIGQYMERNETPSCDIITTCTENQLEADNVLAKLNTVLQIHEARKTYPETSHTKLPTLDPPKFAGDILLFHQFWDKFEATIDRRNLEDVDKLSYLMASLEGKALEVISGLGITNYNYKIAVDTLKRQFGNKDILIDAHYEALKKLPAAQNTNDCRHTLNTVEHHLRVLQTLGESMEGNHLRTTITSKFPDQVLYELKMVLSVEQNTVPNIRKTLEKIVTALEQVKPISSYIPTSAEATSSAQALFQTDTQNMNNKNGKDKSISKGNNNTGYLKSEVPTSKKRKFEKITNNNINKKRKISCIFCDNDHYSSECKNFKTMKERKNKLENKCYKCFRSNHLMKDCKVKRKCYSCKGDHHQALCPKKISGMDNKYNNINNVCQTSCNINTGLSYLQTATVKISNNNKMRKCRLLLDSGSQRSYITSKMANYLKLTTDKEDLLMIYTFGADLPKETLSLSAEIDILTKRGTRRRIRINIVPHITHRVPVPEIQLIPGIDIIADDKSVGEGIDLLIGNDYYMTFMRNRYIKIQDFLFLIDTEFGWVLSGSTAVRKNDKETTLSVITYCQCHDPEKSYFVEPDLPLRDMDVKFLWALESIGITDSPKTTREEEAVKHFTETVKYENGRYQVKWPWIEYPPDLPTNLGLAYGRLKSLVRRLDQSTLKEYETILQEQLDAKIIEVIDPQPINIIQTTPPIHYLPHHIVKHDGKRGRIVYDASTKVKGQRSLNESMYTGPSMLEDLTALLIKFRTNKVGITADVEKAFLQVGLQEDDREVTRFLWLKNLQKEVSEENIIHMRFCRVPFGFISSPFLLTATIRHHLSRTSQELLTKIADRCYVDNLVTTASSSATAYSLYQETRKSFQDLSMNIREWTSNDEDFMLKIPKEHRAKDIENIKVLGLIWNIKNDSLQLKLNNNILNEEHANASITKRDVLRTLASFYDPCGFAVPIVLPAKILLQELWKRKLKWDTALPDDLKIKWESILATLQTAREIKIPRYIGNDEFSKMELHCFTDASKDAHAAVVYLRVINEDNIKMSFIMSKSRVNPLKEMENLKIPRLELLGYVIGSRLLTYAKNALGLPIMKQFLWTDSQVVLSWIKSNKLLPPFVMRRINEIKQNPELKMCYINSEQNPADLATRPDLWPQKKELWFQGPLFLLDKREFWPANSDLIHQESVLSVAAEGLDTEHPENSVNVTTKKQTKIYDTETSNSEVQEIKNLQKEYFKDEVKGKKTDLSRNLGLFLDVDGILRCKGRMTHTDWSYEMKHPILLPKDCEFTRKVISRTHEKNYHVGVSHTLNIIRQQYWIPQGRSQVQKVIRKCPQCVKHGGGPYELPPTPALPPERVTYSSPFTYTGMDYFGPMYVTTDQGKKKRWVCLFTCLVIRAIHLEIVNDLTAQECILALRRFVASRGKPTLIVSDNALQFKLTSEILMDPFCGKIKWKFIPQLAPWHGGVYERMVAVVKHCLKRTLQKHLLDDSQLCTIIKEVECVCNTRPLTYVGSEHGYVLKPTDFLSLGNCLLLETSDGEIPMTGTSIKQNLIESWKRGQRIMRDFKTMFIGQYLSSLREKYHHSKKQPRVKSSKKPLIGDVVQIKGDSKNRENWKVGRISSLISGPDGQCRVAKVKVDDTEYTRSIGHLYPLETEIDDDRKNDYFETQVKEKRNFLENIDQSQYLEKSGTVGTIELLPAERNINVNENVPDSPRFIEGLEATESSDRTELAETLQEVHLDEEMPEPIETSPIPVNSKEVQNETPNTESRNRREAAIRAREKIAEWTRLLIVLLK